MNVKRRFIKRNKNNDKIIVWKKKQNIKTRWEKLDERTRINEVKMCRGIFWYIFKFLIHSCISNLSLNLLWPYQDFFSIINFLFPLLWEKRFNKCMKKDTRNFILTKFPSSNILLAWPPLHMPLIFSCYFVFDNFLLCWIFFYCH